MYMMHKIKKSPALEALPRAGGYYRVTAVVLCLALLFVCSCKSDSSDPRSDWSYKQSPSFAEPVELPKGLGYRGCVGGKLVAHDAGRDLYLLDPKTGELETIYTTEKGFYLKDVAVDSDWIVWVETDGHYTGPYPSRWKMVALNLAERKSHLVDEDGHPNAPFSLAVSNNKLVYCKNIAQGTQAGSQVVLYDLETRESQILQSASKANDELLFDCTIYDNIVVWSKLTEENDDGNFRNTAYKYADVYLYDCKTQITEKLTEGGFYHNPALHENTLVMVSIPQKKPGQRSGNSEIVLMDLSSRSIEVIVDGNSDIYDRVIEEMNRGYPVINSSYIAWYDGWIAHTYLYDYHKKEMIEVIIELDYGSGLRAANEKMLDNGVIVVIYDGSAVRISKTLYIEFLP